MQARDGSRTRLLERRFFLGLHAGYVLAGPFRGAFADDAPSANQAREGRLRPVRMDNEALLDAMGRGAGWLRRQQRDDGGFHYGWIPELDRSLPGDHLLRQAGTAAALAFAGRLTRNQDSLAAATRACDAMLDRYTTIPKSNSNERRPTERTQAHHPIGLAALLLLALCELADAGVHRAEPASQLARYLAARVLPDGSFDLRVTSLDEEDANVGIDFYPGEALYALLRGTSSFPSLPVDALEILERGYPYYRRHWLENRNAAFTPWQSGAHAEAYGLNGRAAHLQFVFAMNDWLLQSQYAEDHDVPEEYMGGFGVLEYERLLRIPPGVASASSLESLAHALRVARKAGDATRVRRYRASIESGLRFLLSLQFSEQNTRHFQPEVATKLDGAFHASVEDGTVRIDFTQHALYAMGLYLESGPERRGHALGASAPDQSAR